MVEPVATILVVAAAGEVILLVSALELAVQAGQEL
jgi:hypothetical protein